MSKIPLLAVVAAIGAYVIYKKGQGPVAGLGHGGHGGHGGHHGGGFRGGWGGGPYWGDYSDTTIVDAGPRAVDCYKDAQGNLVLGVPSGANAGAKRGKCLVGANGTILNMLPTAAGVQGLGWGGFKSVTHALTSSIAAPLKMAAAPIRVAAAPLTASVAAARVLTKGGNISQAGRAATSTFRTENLTPLTVPMKALSPMMPSGVQSFEQMLGSKPGIRVALGRPKPGSNQPTAIVSSATNGPTVTPGVQWTPVNGRPGWETAPGDGGSTVFRNTGTNSTFYCTSSDMSSIGTLQNAIDLFMGVPMDVQSGTAPTSTSSSAAPDTSSQPGQPGSTFVPDTSSSSFSTQAPSGAVLDPTQDPYSPSYIPPQSAPSADPASTVMQQYQPTDTVAPDASKKVSPFVVVGTLIAVPLAFMLTGKK